MVTAEQTQTRAHSTLQKTVLDQFRQITRAYALFHITFFLIGFVELFLFLFFFSFFAKSSMLAFSLAAIFLTGFSYFVLLFYFQAKKPEQFHLLLQNYMQGSKDAHEDILQSLSQLVSLLQGQEHHYYPLPESFKTLAPLDGKVQHLDPLEGCASDERTFAQLRHPRKPRACQSPSHRCECA